MSVEGERRSLAGKGSRFLVTGFVINVTLYAFLAVMLEIGVEYRIGVTAVFVLGMIWGYLQNRLWTWRSETPILRSAILYLTVYIFLYILHIGLVTLLVERGGIDPLLAALCSIFLLVVPVFFAIDRIVFRQWRA